MAMKILGLSGDSAKVGGYGAGSCFGIDLSKVRAVSAITLMV